MSRIIIFLFVGIALQEGSWGGIPITEYSSNNNSDTSDYYWREYSGSIPSDAIPGGLDTFGQKTYIGQVVYTRERLYPATIFPGSKSALTSSGGISFTKDTFVKILCSRNQNRYRWVAIKDEDAHLLGDCHFVLGGTEEEYPLYIGRVHHEMGTVIGKVFPQHTNRGLSIPYKEREGRFWSYEILTYNCNLNRYQVNVTYAEVPSQ